jgi:hypothetical protein
MRRSAALPVRPPDAMNAIREGIDPRNPDIDPQSLGIDPEN